MSAVDVPPSWYPDPANPSFSYRWWDGTQWTDYTRTAQSLSNEYASGNTGHMSTWNSQRTESWVPTVPSSAGSVYASDRYNTSGAHSYAHKNHRSLTAIAVAALYVLIAATSHVVFFGIVPAAAAVRAFKRREPLAPVAALAAVIAIVVAVAALSTH